MTVLNSRKHRLGARDNPTVGLFVSTDAGTSWQHRGWRGYIRTFYSEVGPDGTIWSACGNGVLQSTDNGGRWRIATGWEITEVLKVKVDPSNPAIIYAVTAYGIFKTIDHGKIWYEKNVGFQNPFTSDVLVDRSKNLQLFAATEEGVFRSRDGGDHWLLAGLEGKGIRTIVQDPKDFNKLYVGTEDDGFCLSGDGGNTWNRSNEGLQHRTVYAIAVDGQNSRTIFLGTHGGGVYRSLDGGKNWEQKGVGLKNLDVHSLVTLPSNSQTVFAGTLNGGLYRSTNGGESWEFNSQEEAQVWGLSVR